MFARLFIARPVLAAVVSIAILLAGLVSLLGLPVSQYPQIAPPSVSVNATYPGADAAAVAQTVALPLERSINGVDHMLYMQSQISDGALQLTVTFAIGTDPDQATINVSNRVQQVLGTLPDEVRRQSIPVTKSSNGLLGILSLTSSDRRQDDLFLSAYAQRQVLDEMKRVPGIADAQLFGQKDFAMRVWLHPDKLAQYRLTAGDVADAIRAQNQLFATGTLNGAPSQSGAYTYGMVSGGELADAAAFGRIILRADPSGPALLLSDVARVELGSEHYEFDAKQDDGVGMPIGLTLQPGANALTTMAGVRARIAVLARSFPAGMSYSFPLDSTTFVDASIREVLTTFAEALGLVCFVVVVFLRSWRATLIPLAAVPVSIIGTFAGLYLAGYSINLLTLFGLLLAIGIVVDDAIVVVEATMRHIESEQVPAPEATRRALAEVQGPVVATVLVLAAVFLPVAFFGGLTGQLYRQFAITITIAVAISGLVALTLTPALCALLLRPERPRGGPLDRLGRAVARAYARLVRWLLRQRVAAGALFLLLCAGTAVLAERLPVGFIPEEDQGSIFVVWSLEPAATLRRTEAVMQQVIDAVRSLHLTQVMISFAGYNQLSNGNQTNAGSGFITLLPWHERSRPGQDEQSLVGRLMGLFAAIPDAQVFAFGPPAIEGLGNIGGFQFHIEDRQGAGLPALEAALGDFLHAAAGRPELAALVPTLQTTTPRQKVSVDREKAAALDVPVSQIYAAIQATFGSLYVNDFMLGGQNYHVDLQSDLPFRRNAGALDDVYVRTAPSGGGAGEMVPLAPFVRLQRVAGADTLERFDVYPAAQINANAAAGYTTAQAIAAVQAIARTALPPGFGVDFDGAAYQQIAAEHAGRLVLVLGLVSVALILAALYESWRLPLAVMLSVPFAILGALLAVWVTGHAIDLYVQIGFVALIGLAAKNAVLIVQYAADRHRAGLPRAAAALEAAQLRLRPIVMTSLTFILGTLPLALSTGAGAGARRSLGIGLVGGMLAATVLGTLFVPLFYAAVAKRDRSGMGHRARLLGLPQPRADVAE